MSTVHPTLLAIEALDLATVTPFLLARHAPRKAQAEAVRALFKRHGLKQISVTVPTYSMAQGVNVRIPHAEFSPEEHAEWRTAYDRDEDTNTTTTLGRTRTREHEAAKKVKALLSLAFPNHDDRSDLQSDYFNYCWMVD